MPLVYNQKPTHYSRFGKYNFNNLRNHKYFNTNPLFIVTKYPCPHEHETNNIINALMPKLFLNVKVVYAKIV